jgi:hypothetical protein
MACCKIGQEMGFFFIHVDHILVSMDSLSGGCSSVWGPRNRGRSRSSMCLKTEECALDWPFPMYNIDPIWKEPARRMILQIHKLPACLKVLLCKEVPANMKRKFAQCFTYKQQGILVREGLVSFSCTTFNQPAQKCRQSSFFCNQITKKLVYNVSDGCWSFWLYFVFLFAHCRSTGWQSIFLTLYQMVHYTSFLHCHGNVLPYFPHQT